jgi:hypothetical protein
MNGFERQDDQVAMPLEAGMHDISIRVGTIIDGAGKAARTHPP